MGAGSGDLDVRLARFLEDPAARIDPYPFLRELRENAPVHQGPDGTWFVTSYDGCISLLRDPFWSNVNPHARQDGTASGRARSMIGSMVLFNDTPEHARLRRLLGRVFLKPNAEQKRAHFRHEIERLLDRLHPLGGCDFPVDFARLIPLHMICDLLGLPQERYADLVDWSRRYAAMLSVNVTPEMERSADAGFAEFEAYLEPILEDKRRAPGQDLLSEWIGSEERGEMSRDEIASFCLFILVAGHSTTTYLMTNAIFTLLRHPDEWARLKADPSLKQSMVEEVLRFESSGRAFVPRWAKQDAELLGKTIRKGEMIVGIESAANRDPKYFPDPDRFDITRQNNRHLSFVGGPHVCAGQFVARVETQEAIAAVAERLPDVALEREPVWDPVWISRAISSLPVRWTAAA